MWLLSQEKNTHIESTTEKKHFKNTYARFIKYSLSCHVSFYKIVNFLRLSGIYPLIFNNIGILKAIKYNKNEILLVYETLQKEDTFNMANFYFEDYIHDNVTGGYGPIRYYKYCKEVHSTLKYISG